MIRNFLHVGCGGSSKAETTKAFASSAWQEVRYDIDPGVKPDIVGSMLDMQTVPDRSMDAVFSSHNIEHLYPHQVPIALKEFHRVLGDDGFAIITCPDIQSVAELVVEDKLTDVAYVSPAGPIAAIDMLYGHRPSLQKGNEFMAHKCGFTMKVLIATLRDNGFSSVAAIRRPGPAFDLWAIATKQEVNEAAIKELAKEHFPS